MDCFELQIVRKALTGATCEERQCEPGGEAVDYDRESRGTYSSQNPF